MMILLEKEIMEFHSKVYRNCEEQKKEDKDSEMNLLNERKECSILKKAGKGIKQTAEGMRKILSTEEGRQKQSMRMLKG